MSEQITAYPLQWPVGKPRTEPGQRSYGRFGTKNDKGWREGVTVHSASSRVMNQLSAMDGGRSVWVRIKNIVISTNLQVRNDGLPRSGQRAPDDPGVAVYFELDGKQRCIPCDYYTKVEQNLAAVAATVDALRTIERHGSEMFEAAFTGFTALPGPDAVSTPHWRTVLNIESECSDIELVKRRYRRLIKGQHPDQGGNSGRFEALTAAWKQAQAELRASLDG